LVLTQSMLTLISREVFSWSSYIVSETSTLENSVPQSRHVTCLSQVPSLPPHHMQNSPIFIFSPGINRYADDISALSKSAGKVKNSDAKPSQLRVYLFEFGIVSLFELIVCAIGEQSLIVLVPHGFKQSLDPSYVVL